MIIRRDAGTGLVMRVTLAVIPQRLGVPADAADPAEAGLDLLADLVATDGLRAQLASSGLLSQSLHVNLAELADAEPGQPRPRRRSLPGAAHRAVRGQRHRRLGRERDEPPVQSLPIEELMSTFTTLLANVNALVTEEGFRSAPANIGALIADIREVVETSGIKETPAQIAATLASIQAVVAEVETQELMTELAARSRPRASPSSGSASPPRACRR